MADIKLNPAIPNPRPFKTALADVWKRGPTVTGSHEDLGIASGPRVGEGTAALRRIGGIDSVGPDRQVSISTAPP